MKNRVDVLTDYDVNDYLIVIKVSDDIREKVGKIKEQFSKSYKTPFTKTYEPHIALVKFCGLQLKEERIIQRLSAIAHSTSPFMIELKDFGSLPAHTIFFPIASRIQLDCLSKELKTAQAVFKLSNDYKPHFIEDLHITIGSKLKPWQYEQAWIKYAHLEFSARFIAEDIHLLKRKSGDKSYKNYRLFAFRGESIKAEQGKLFT